VCIENCAAIIIEDSKGREQKLVEETKKM
jgi:hypothetical protein